MSKGQKPRTPVFFPDMNYRKGRRINRRYERRTARAFEPFKITFKIDKFQSDALMEALGMASSGRFAFIGESGRR